MEHLPPDGDRVAALASLVSQFDRVIEAVRLTPPGEGQLAKSRRDALENLQSARDGEFQKLLEAGDGEAEARRQVALAGQGETTRSGALRRRDADMSYALGLSDAEEAQVFNVKQLERGDEVLTWPQVGHDPLVGVAVVATLAAHHAGRAADTIQALRDLDARYGLSDRAKSVARRYLAEEGRSADRKAEPQGGREA